MNVFGQPAVLTPLVSAPGAASSAFSGIWTNASVEIQEGEGMYRTVNQPMLGCRVSQFAILPQQLDQIVTNNVTYEIIDVVKDGQGGVSFWLRQTSGITTVVPAADNSEQCAPNCRCWKCKRKRS